MRCSRLGCAADAQWNESAQPWRAKPDSEQCDDGASGQHTAEHFAER
jgi:hypothetical protein